jgi:TonB family protein
MAMSSIFQRDGKVQWWLALGPLLFSLAVTALAVNLCGTPEPATRRPADFNHTHEATTAASSEAGSNRHVLADPAPEGKAPPSNTPLPLNRVDGHLGPVGSGHVDAPGAATQGHLASSAIASVIATKVSGINYCYESYGLPAATGKVVVNFTIGTTGEVVQYSIESSTLNNHDVEQCMLRMLRRWRFTEPAGGEVNVSYPFYFPAFPQGMPFPKEKGHVYLR